MLLFALIFIIRRNAYYIGNVWLFLNYHYLSIKNKISYLKFFLMRDKINPNKLSFLFTRVFIIKSIHIT